MKPLIICLLLVTISAGCGTEKMAQNSVSDYFVSPPAATTHYFRINPAVEGDDQYYFNLKNQQLPVTFPAAQYPEWDDYFKAVLQREQYLTPSAIQFCYEALFREYKLYTLPGTQQAKAAAVHGMTRLTAYHYLGYSVMYNILLWMKNNGLTEAAAGFKQTILNYAITIEFPSASSQATGTENALDRAMELQRANMGYLQKIKDL